MKLSNFFFLEKKKKKDEDLIFFSTVRINHHDTLRHWHSVNFGPSDFEEYEGAPGFLLLRLALGRYAGLGELMSC